ncbi:MAG: hypothetical protein OXP36_05265 [Gammaproteobacteria bacterium]|nr:hypothetical protein [Gammaproteobacteria bacterium]
MEFQEFVPSAPYVASVLVVGLFLWRVFVRVLSGMEARFNDRFGQVESRFDDRSAQMDKRFDDRSAQMEKRFDDRFAQIDHRFEEMNGRFASLEKKVDGLADDHHSISRELSEFRGEMRGRLSVLVPQAAGDT